MYCIVGSNVCVLYVVSYVVFLLNVKCMHIKCSKYAYCIHCNLCICMLCEHIAWCVCVSVCVGVLNVHCLCFCVTCQCVAGCMLHV